MKSVDSLVKKKYEIYKECRDGSKKYKVLHKEMESILESWVIKGPCNNSCFDGRSVTVSCEEHFRCIHYHIYLSTKDNFEKDVALLLEELEDGPLKWYTLSVSDDNRTYVTYRYGYKDMKCYLFIDHTMPNTYKMVPTGKYKEILKRECV